MRPRKGELCSNDERLVWKDKNGHRLPSVKTIVCRETAVTVRKGWRFGDAKKGEPAVVDTRHPLCADCAESWDDAASELAGEAAAS